MKVSQSQPQQSYEDSLSPDDYVNCSISHQLKINGDDTWIKYEAGTKVRPGENAEEVYDRISTYVNEKAMALAERTAKRVMES